jgi:beta-glucosidase
MYDAQNKTPAYPFGYGLSYTTFDYDQSSLKMNKQTLSVDVANTGKVFGKEVVQMYIGFPSSTGEPPK